MSYEIHCGDVMPGCPATLRADSQDQLLNDVVAHARDAHDVQEVTPAIAEQVQAAIHPA